jgi:hypothetical protein
MSWRAALCNAHSKFASGFLLTVICGSLVRSRYRPPNESANYGAPGAVFLLCAGKHGHASVRAGSLVGKRDHLVAVEGRTEKDSRLIANTLALARCSDHFSSARRAKWRSTTCGAEQQAQVDVSAHSSRATPQSIGGSAQIDLGFERQDSVKSRRGTIAGWLPPFQQMEEACGI